MSHFSRMIKSEIAVRKDGDFQSMDMGGKDAGASKRMMGAKPVEASMHMRDVADQHDREGDTHAQVAEKTKMMGLDKRAAEHREVANEHMLAAGHYRAAASAIEGARDRVDPMDDQNKYLDAGKDHLATARQCAGKAKACCEKMK
jgi:hypothetical protein